MIFYQYTTSAYNNTFHFKVSTFMFNMIFLFWLLIYQEKKPIFLALRFEYSPLHLWVFFNSLFPEGRNDHDHDQALNKRKLLRLSTWAKVRFFPISLTLSLCNVNRHWRERESHARTWINAFINIPVIYIACSYLWRIFCYIICLCISRFSAFVYQEKKNRIKCDYRCRVINFILGCTAFSR